MTDFFDNLLAFTKNFYNLENETKNVHGNLVKYDINTNVRLRDFLLEIFDFDIVNFKQIESLNQLIDIIEYGKNESWKALGDSKLSIGIRQNKIVFFYGSDFRFSVSSGQKKDDIEFDIYSNSVTLLEILDNSAHENIYQSLLTDLKSILVQDMNLKSFINTLKTDIKDIINNKIKNNNVCYLTSDQFNNLDCFIELNKQNSSNNNDNPIDINANNYKLDKYLKDFVSANNIKKINEILTLFFFNIQIDDSLFKSKEFIVTIIDYMHKNKFKESYELYEIYLSRGFNYSRCLLISTDETFLTYIFEDENGELNRIEGVDAIYDHLKEIIADKISKNLDIDKKDINNKSVEVYTMMSL